MAMRMAKGERLKVKGERLLVFLVAMLLCLPVCADKRKDLDNQKKKLQNEIAQTNKMLKETKNNESATLNKLHLIGENIKNQRLLINTLDNEIQELDREMNRLTATRDSFQVVLEQYKEDYAQTVRKTHYSRMQQTPILFILSSDDFQQAIRRTRFLQQFAQFRKDQVERIKNTQAEIDVQNALLLENKTDKQNALNQRKQEQENLQRDEKKQKKMLNQLQSKEKDLTKKLQQQQKKVADINKKIDDLIRQEAENAKKQKYTKEQELLAGGFEKNKGRLPWPIDRNGTALITGHYGKHQHPIYPQVTIDNKGIYIQTSAGTKVRSVYDGEVTKCFMIGGINAVIVQHGAYRTVYSNLIKLEVKQGDKVKSKQNLGTVYTDAEQDNKTELYFQIYKDKNILNPELWITK